MKRILTGSLIALLFAVVLQADARITGKWEGTTGNGTPIVLDLTATDAALTGTLTRAAETATIADGKVSKQTFTFKATLGDQTEGFTGELAGDELKVWLDRRGPESTVVLKRVKK